MAMGTGLGVALLLKSRTHPKHEVLPMEFGHVIHSTLGPEHPISQEERRMREYISRKLYHGDHDLETEDICSGRGLGFTYEWIASEHPDAPQKLTVPEIAKAASDGNLYAVKALNIVYSWLFRSAANLSIGFLAGGVFLAGDNQVNNLLFVESNLEEFKKKFLNFPKEPWINNIPVYTQYEYLNINILGALHFAQHFSTI